MANTSLAVEAGTDPYKTGINEGAGARPSDFSLTEISTDSSIHKRQMRSEFNISAGNVAPGNKLDELIVRLSVAGSSGGEPFTASGSDSMILSPVWVYKTVTRPGVSNEKVVESMGRIAEDLNRFLPRFLEEKGGEYLLTEHPIVALREVREACIGRARELEPGLPDLAILNVTSAYENALADVIGAIRPEGPDFYSVLRALPNPPGLDLHAVLGPNEAPSVPAAVTVGLGFPLEGLTPNPADGLPVSLQGWLHESYREASDIWVKLKVGLGPGEEGFDPVETRANRVLEAYRVINEFRGGREASISLCLDFNEDAKTPADLEMFQQVIERIRERSSADPRYEGCFESIKCLEQPVDRVSTFSPEMNVAVLKQLVPHAVVVIDEAGIAADDSIRAAANGYDMAPFVKLCRGGVGAALESIALAHASGSFWSGVGDLTLVGNLERSAEFARQVRADFIESNGAQNVFRMELARVGAPKIENGVFKKSDIPSDPRARQVYFDDAVDRYWEEGSRPPADVRRPPLEITTDDALLELNSRPTDHVYRAMAEIGDEWTLVAGLNGKTGIERAKMALRAGGKIIGVSRFSEDTARGLSSDDVMEKVRGQLLSGLPDEAADRLQLRRADLSNPNEVQSLPDAKYVLLLAGLKFTRDESAESERAREKMNVDLPGIVVDRYAGSKIVYLSSAGVYPFTDIASSGFGCTEEYPLTADTPPGNYNKSRLRGEERITETVSHNPETQVVLMRLAYATSYTYGGSIDVLRQAEKGEVNIDGARAVMNQLPAREDNAISLCLFGLCDNPPRVVNVTGPAVTAQDIAEFAATRDAVRYPASVVFSGVPGPNALIVDGRAVLKELQYVPETSIWDHVAGAVTWRTHGGKDQMSSAGIGLKDFNKETLAKG